MLATARRLPMPQPTAEESTAARNEEWRIRHDEGVNRLGGRLTYRQIGRIYGVDGRTVHRGVVAARALRKAVADVTADDS